jgi:amino-acid N-acetyltransferase
MFTRDGSGTMISRDLYDGIRRATVDDITGIEKVIEPLVASGNLVPRPRDMMEKEISSYYVYTRDDMIVACGQLRRWEEDYAEIGCLVVHEDYRRSGRGDAMLSYLERLCVESGASKVFVLSTVTMHWFVERGFKQKDISELPISKRDVIDMSRNSKPFIKVIKDERELDTEELFWDR